MLLTNVGSWYFNNNATYKLASYFDLNNNLIERVSNTDCSSMGNAQTICQIRYSTDPTDRTRYCGKFANIMSTGLIFYPIPYLPEYRTSGQTSWFKMPTTVINTSCPDTEYYSLVNKRLEFYFYVEPYKGGYGSFYLINTMNCNANENSSYTLGYDVMIETMSERPSEYFLRIYYNNNTNPNVTPQMYPFAMLNLNQWYKMIIDFEYNTNNTNSYHCVFNLYDTNDTLLETFSEGPYITLDPSINTNSYGFRFFEQWSGRIYTNKQSYIKEVKLYQKS